MHITRAGDYGVQGMIYLASLPEGKDAYIGEIARARDLPSSFLAKIFQNLNKAGLVRSQRGARGGFTLARPAREISVLNIIEGIEGPLFLSDCLGKEGNCKRQKICPLYDILGEAQNILIEALNKYSLEDLSEIENRKTGDNANS